MAGREAGASEAASSFLENLSESVFRHIYDHLKAKHRWALWCTCRSLRSQVEQCVHTLVLGLRPRPDAATACDKQLAASALRPKKLVFGNTSYTSAVLSSPKAVEVWQAVTAVEARHPLRGKTAMALASSIPNLRELQVHGQVQPASDWRPILLCFSRLHTLSLDSGAPPAFYEALQHVPSLRSLTAMSCFNYLSLATLTQLQDLTLPVPRLSPRNSDEVSAHPSIQGPGISVLDRLTCLTALQFPTPGEFIPEEFEAPLIWQNQLSCALTALNKLQRLQLPRVWSGPFAVALSQMTALTQLSLTVRQPALDKGLALPKVQLLRLLKVDLGFLSTLQAPKLQAIQGNVLSDGSGVGKVQVNLGEVEMGVQQQVALLEECARGVLRRCNRLVLGCTCKNSTDGRLVAALQALGKSWQPDASLVDGSSPHVQFSAPSSMVSKTGAASKAAAGGWHLTVPELPCSREALAALPQGLTHLNLGNCMLYPDSLDPLATLSSLRHLIFSGSPHVSKQAITRLLSSAVQGCMLKVELRQCVVAEVKEECIRARAALVVEKGSRNVPRLVFR